MGGEIIIDAQVSNSPIFIKTSTAERTFLSGSIVIENIVLNNVPIAVIDGDGTTLLEGTNGTTVIDQWVQGNVYKGTNPTGVYEQQSLTKPKKPANLLKNGKVLGRPRNQYDNYAPSRKRSRLLPLLCCCSSLIEAGLQNSSTSSPTERKGMV